MRTKTKILAAGFVAAGALSSMAQNVYSVNVVGYVNVTIPNGFTLIENPLNAADNHVGALFAYNTTNLGGSSPALGDYVYFWNGSALIPNQNDPYGSGFADPTIQLPPGHGFMVLHNGPAYTNTFVGTVLQGTLSNNLPAGFNLVGSQVPQAGFMGDLGQTTGPTAGQGDYVYLWNGTSFVPVQNDPYGTGWPTSVPGFTMSATKGAFIPVAGAWFYLNQGGGTPLATFVRNFTVQ